MADGQLPAPGKEKRHLSRSIEWGAIVLATIGTLLLLTGAWRFFLRQHFGVSDLLYCLLWFIPAALLVPVFDFTFHHARLVVAMPLVIAIILALGFPGFDIALGLVLTGTVFLPAINDWQQERIRKRLVAVPERDEVCE